MPYFDSNPEIYILTMPTVICNQSRNTNTYPYESNDSIIYENVHEFQPSIQSKSYWLICDNQKIPYG